MLHHANLALTNPGEMELSLLASECSQEGHSGIKMTVTIMPAYFSLRPP